MAKCPINTDDNCWKYGDNLSNFTSSKLSRVESSSYGLHEVLNVKHRYRISVYSLIWKTVGCAGVKKDLIIRFGPQWFQMEIELNPEPLDCQSGPSVALLLKDQHLKQICQNLLSNSNKFVYIFISKNYNKKRHLFIYNNDRCNKVEIIIVNNANQ